jgi:hypothetical protein
MDPVTAIGLASSILAFVEFSWHLIHGTHEVYVSSTGLTAENAHVSNILDDLTGITDALATDLEGRDKHERALIQLASQCQLLSAELGALLHKLQAKDKSTWASLRVKQKSMRREKEVASLEKRLASYREEILLRTDMMIL